MKMATEEIGLVQAQRLQNGLNSQLMYQEESLRFSCGAPQRPVPDPGPKTRELSGFIDERFFQAQGSEFQRRSMFGEAVHKRPENQERPNWNVNGRASTTPSGDGSEGNEDEDDDDDDEDDDDEADEGDGEVEGLVGMDDSNNKNNNNSSGHSSADNIGNGKSKHLSSFVGSSRELMVEDCNIVQSGNNNNNKANARPSPGNNHPRARVSQYQNAVTIADPDGDLYYPQYLQGQEASASGQKDLVAVNGCMFSGRRDGPSSAESGESLRTILSDPLTGALMDDAMILPCGHSFGGGGIQHVMRMKACYTCAQVVSEDSVAPNLSLRAAVQAFRREEELQVNRSSKRRREKFEQEKSSFNDSVFMDHPRGRGVQFPFVVTDRVIIKGNKRTPQRFVGREAVVTTQCLNGWYVVKTLDNAESVKLQYRSLDKVPSTNTSTKPTSPKVPPNWL